jgi:hypothetical protein
LVEGAIPLIVVGAGIALWEQTPYLLWYAAQAIVGSWVYPMLISEPRPTRFFVACMDGSLTAIRYDSAE